MSRHTLSCGGNMVVIVGWDAPMRTFFCQVFDRTIDEDEPELWLGADRCGEIPTVSALALALHPYVRLPKDKLAELERDRQSESR